jgi:lipopolysaccharide transport system permease protein
VITKDQPDAMSIHGKSAIGRFFTLLRALVIRDIKGRYRRSLLGPTWAILQPLLYMAVFILVRNILGIPSDGIPYPLFAFSALVPWTFLSQSLTRAGPCVLNNRGIIKKIALSREIFPLTAVGTSLVDFFLASTILLGMLFWYQVSVGWSVLFVPVLILLSFLFALGLGLGISAVGTYRQDVVLIIPVGMQLWMLATPIMYPLSRVPERWRYLYDLNPMVGIIEGFRSVLLRGAMPDLGLLACSCLGILVVWVIAWPLFRFFSQYFADVL